VATFYNYPTALIIYQAIETGGAQGLDLEQLRARLPSPKKKGAMMAGNTIRTYCRWLQEQDSINITETEGDSDNKALKNLYIAITPPQPKPSEGERLKEIIKILEPYSKRPDSWDKSYKANITYAIQAAIKKAL